MKIFQTALPSIGLLWLIVVIFFPLGIGVSLRDVQGSTESSTVPNPCTCECWDGLFKGPYSRGGYKSVYFNLDWGTGALLFVLLVYAHLSEALLSFFLRMKFGNWAMVSCLLATIFPNFYGFWMTFNYVNDRFYKFWWTQLYFTVSELWLGVASYNLAQVGAVQSVFTLEMMASMSFCHIVLSGAAQGFSHIFLGERGQTTRDIFFGVGDIVILMISSKCLLKHPVFNPRQSLVRIATVATFLTTLFVFLSRLV